jgi:hypothetical protein
MKASGFSRLIFPVLTTAVLFAGVASGCTVSAFQSSRDQVDHANNVGADKVATETMPSPTALASQASEDGSDEGVETRLGSQTLRIPREYLRLRLDPSSDQRFELAILLPKLGPVPRGYASMGLSGAAVSEIVVIHRAGKSPSQLFSEWLGQAEGATTPDPLAGDKPRVRGEQVWGLVPYSLDFEALRRQAQARGEKADTVASPHRVYNLDRYLSYDSGGAMTALIECTSKTLDDGIEVVDGVLQRIRTGNTDTLAVCDHGFAIDALDATVNIQYPRAYLSDWRRIEQRVRDLIEAGRTGHGRSR